MHPEAPLGSPPATEPGQATYEAWAAALDARGVGCDVWYDQDGDEQAAWAAVEAERGAQLAAVTAERDKLAAELRGVHGELTASGIKGDPENHWAPLLIAQLRRERDAARKAYATLRAAFTQGAQTGWSARVSGTVLHRLDVLAMHEPGAATACCDLHGRNCEPEEPCCERCTEVRHAGWRDEAGVLRYGHPRGEVCSAPDLSVLAAPQPGGSGQEAGQ